MPVRGFPHRPIPTLAVLAVGFILAGPASAANFCVNTAPQLVQALIDARGNGQDDTIQLVQGTYVGNFSHIADFNALRIEGGYTPGCGSRVVDPANTVLDGNAAGQTLRMFSNNPVTFGVDGVTVQNGRALVNNPNINGGGLWLIAGNVTPGGTVTVTNCIVRNNQAAQDGGGVYIFKAGNATIAGTTIQNNFAGFGGGFYSTDNTNVTMTGNLLSGNSTAGGGTGGGMFVDMTFPNRGGSGSSSLSATGNTFSANSAAISGGAFFVCAVANAGGSVCSATTGWTATISFSGNVIAANSAGSGAGASVINGNSVSFDANTFAANGGSNAGGASFLDVDALTLTNNLVYGNQVTGVGAGIDVVNADVLTATNNTLTGNTSSGGSGGGGGLFVRVRDDADSASIFNNVVWGNSASVAADIYIDNNGNGNGVFSPVALQNNDFDQSSAGFIITQPGFVVPGSNLNDANPLFVSPGGSDYHLQAGSPCRDTGNNGAPALPPLDHDFLPRIVGPAVDIGAFELQSADLAITKTDGQASAVPGTPVTYTITVTNAGPSPVPSATVTDTPPAVLTGVTWTCVASGGSSCPASGSGAINHTASVAVGGTLTYTLTGTVSPTATGTLANTASVATQPGIPDSNPANNSATDTDTLTPQADLAATKTDSQASAVPGLPIAYQMTVTNAGPSSVTGATVSDTVPGSLSGVTWTCSATAGSSCPASGAGSINHSVTVAPGGVLTYALTGTIASSATGTLSNNITVTAPGGVTDPVGANNAATDTDTLAPRADLRITKSDGQSAATPGGGVTYTIVALNPGPSDAPGSTIADAFPGSITGVTWTCTPSAGASCGGGGGSGNINRVVSLPAGGLVTFVASGTVGAGATGTLANTATATTAGGVTDPDPSNNSATDVDNLTLAGLSELVHGSERVRSLDSAAPGGPANLFWLRQAPRASYEVVVDGVTGDVASPAGTGPSLQLLGPDATTVVQTATAAGAGASRSLRFENASSAPRTDQFVRVQSAGCTTTCGPQDLYRIRAWETTYSATRFNNSASQVSVLLVENRTASSVSGNVWFWGGTGLLAGSQPFTLAPHGLLSLNTATVVPGLSGSLTISHDGPYGALAGKAVAVEPATGFTFDTPLLPRER